MFVKMYKVNVDEVWCMFVLRNQANDEEKVERKYKEKRKNPQGKNVGNE
jgi:hypothetical protein